MQIPKIITVALLLISTYLSVAQVAQSPSQYLGYTVGSKYTPHYKVVNYFTYLASVYKDNIVYKPYGITNEGRQLTYATISSKENILNMPTILASNLARAKMAKPMKMDNVAIVWLSYNVHGNEPSGTEAAMLTAYELLTKHTTDWLANTMVVIDPCLNPDGRDRYVNWYNGVVGNTPNANPASREHIEPWPGGRVNHYYFDLNRDWAWQSQVETQARIKIYNQYLPHVHVDFHEQGINEPYYFAPAAEPMHEVITPWQKEFQTTIGKNNASYFDNNGWYYFTKERFDLFYPSYGDTYPTYNGSIGMTYEQGGHSRGGLTVQLDNGDTLTLVDRALHHHTTGLSTVEVSSQNAAKLLSNFEQYYANSDNGVGSQYKSYVLTSNDDAKLTTLATLLTSNAIQYMKVNALTGTGFNYATNNTENIVLEKYTVLVSAYQPKSLLAKVLLEPKSKLSDTATYDITAWSLPYAHGIKAYASTTKLAGNDAAYKVTTTTVPSTNFALYIPYTSLESAKVLAALLQLKTKIYINEKEITYNKKIYQNGTIIIPKKENAALWKKIETTISKYNVVVDAVQGGFVDKGPDLGSPDIKYINAPRIACATGTEVGANASGELWHMMDAEIDYPLTMLNASDIRLRTLKQYDVLILPDGYYKMLQNKNDVEDLKTWIKMGGRLVLIEGAASQVANTDWGIKLKKDDDKEVDDKKGKTDYTALKQYGNRDRDEIPTYIPGAIYQVTLDITHPLAFGLQPTYYTLKQNSDILEYSKDAWNVGSIKKNAVVSGFAGHKVLDKLKDGTVLAVQEMGSGAIVYFIDDPIFRSFWQGGKQLLFNALFLVGNNAVRL